MSTQPTPFLTPEQYLEIERKAEFRSEYYNGEMFAMAGASRVHSLIAANLLSALHQQLRRKPCEVYSHDMRVRVTATNLYTYPDLVGVCGEPRMLDGHFDTLLNPTLVVEILSPSTEAYDRGLKFENYRSVESLSEYVLVASDRVHVDVYTRQPGGQWLLTSANRIEDTVELRSMGCHINLGDVYEKVDVGRQTHAEAR